MLLLVSLAVVKPSEGVEQLGAFLRDKVKSPTCCKCYPNTLVPAVE